jgi:hypothetical protein
VRIAIFSAFLILSTACAARINPNDEITFQPDARPSYFWAVPPAKALYEGDISVPITLSSRTSAITDASYRADASRPFDCFTSAFRDANNPTKRETGTRIGCTVRLVPHVVVRQLAGGSVPVRTPTFNPTFDYTHFLAWYGDGLVGAMKSIDQDKKDLGGGPYSARILSIRTSLAHYSNGQEGCTFVNCEQGAPNDELNTTNGSFSLNYFELAGGLSFLKFDGEGTQRGSQTSIKGSARVHLPGPLGGIASDLRRSYGWGILGLGGELRLFIPHRRVRGVAQLSSGYEFALERGRSGNDGRFEAGASYSLFALGGLGVAVRYIHGWDYYNIGFGRQLNHKITVGLTIDHSVGIALSDSARKRAIFGR